MGWNNAGWVQENGWYRNKLAAGGGPFTFVSGVTSTFTNGGGSSTGGTTSAINTTGAGLLIAVTSYFSSAASLVLTDSKGNSWTPLTAAASTNTGCNIYYSVPTSVGASHTLTLTGTSVFPTLVFASFAFGAASPADQQSSTNGTAASAAGSSITPGFANELVISGLAVNTNGVAISGIDSGFTLIGTPAAAASGDHIGGGGAYLIQTSAAAAAPTWTFGASNEYAIKMASFKVT